MAKRRARRESTPAKPEFIDGQRELIISARPDAMVRATTEGVASTAGADVKSIEQIIRKAKGKLHRLFGVAEDALIAERMEMEAGAEAPLPDLSVYYQVEAADERLDELAEELCSRRRLTPPMSSRQERSRSDLSGTTRRPPPPHPPVTHRQLPRPVSKHGRSI